MMHVIGFVPDADISVLTLDVLHQVIMHIMNSRSNATSPFIPENPDMDRKIEFNGLSSNIAMLMKVAMTSENAIEDYFQNNNNFMKDELRNRFNTFYHEGLLCRY